MSDHHLVLVPGLLCDEALWDPQVHWLSELVNISFGEVHFDSNFADMAGRILASAPEKFALAGLSMGGYVCMEIMSQAPERVERLALFDTTARADTVDQMKQRRALMKLATIGKFKGVTSRRLPLLIHPNRQSDEVVTRRIIDMAARIGQKSYLRQQTLDHVASRPPRRNHVVR